MDLGLAGRVYLVTGGSKGLGFATAKALVDDGARVVLSSRSQENVDAAVAELGENAIGVAGDNADAGLAERMVSAANPQFGRIDGMLVSVGGPPVGDVLDSSEQAWQDAFSSIFVGTLRLVRRVVEELRDGGAIGLVLSTSVREPLPTPCHLQRPAAWPCHGRQDARQRGRAARDSGGQPVAGRRSRPSRNAALFADPEAVGQADGGYRAAPDRRAGGVRPSGGVRAVAGCVVSDRLCARRGRRCAEGPLGLVAPLASRQLSAGAATVVVVEPAVDSYAEHPAPALGADVLVCTWSRTTAIDPRTYRIVPDGCVDLVWTGRDCSSPDTRPAGPRARSRAPWLGVRFRPGGGSRPCSACRPVRAPRRPADRWPRSPPTPGRKRLHTALADQLVASAVPSVSPGVSPSAAEALLAGAVLAELRRDRLDPAMAAVVAGLRGR